MPGLRPKAPGTRERANRSLTSVLDLGPGSCPVGSCFPGDTVETTRGGVKPSSAGRAAGETRGEEPNKAEGVRRVESCQI